MKDIDLIRLFRSPDTTLVLQAILEDAPAYSAAISGQPPSSDAAAVLLSELPEGKAYDDKFMFGLRLGDELIGCADVVRNYPEAETAFLGLLLIREQWQGRGFGGRAYGHLEQLIAGWGCTKVRLAVVEANRAATDFWIAGGFRPTGERRDYRVGSVQSELVLMEKLLG